MAILMLVIQKFVTVYFEAMIPPMIAFSCGVLLGDTFIHIVPHVYMHSSDLTEDEQRANNFMIILGFFGFFIIDVIFGLLGIGHHSHDLSDTDKVAHYEKPVESPHNHQEQDNIKIETENQQLSNQIAICQNCHIEENEKNNTITNSKESLWKGKGSAGWLNLLCEIFHNVLDGLAIGIAFSTGTKSLVISNIIAVCGHEIPSEMSDIMILLKANFKRGQIVLLNTIVNFTAIVGCIIGLGLGDGADTKSRNYLNLIVGGNFMYLACVAMLPSLLKEKNKWRVFLMLVFFWIGVIALFLVTFAEEHDHGHESEHNHESEEESH